MPASPKDVAAYLEDRLETGARPSTLRVVAAAIARNHKDAGFDVPVDHGVARTMLDELTREEESNPIAGYGVRFLAEAVQPLKTP